MRIAYHIGAHCTDEGRLLKSILKNTETLLQRGVHVPPPRKYRNIIRETIQGLNGAPPAPRAREVLMDAILGAEDVPAMVLSNPLFICVPKRIFENSVLYHLADEKVSGMRALFPYDEIHYFMGLRNPASFIPATYIEQKDHSYADFMRQMTPGGMRWSDAIMRIRNADPDAKITVWCDEETPLIWGQLVRAITGLDPMDRISGGFDLLQALLTDDGMRLFVTYLRANPPRSEEQKRRIIAAFLEKHAREGVMDAPADLPGWDQALVDHLTDLYDADLDKIAQMDGVTLISA